MEELLRCNAVQEAFRFLKEDDERALQETLEMCQIPAPSYQEEKKAEYVFHKMQEAGLEDVHIDEVGNVLGVRKGNGNGPRIVLAGHTDTVFPMETDLTLKQDGNRYSCPGIGDDTRAVAELLSIARAMNAVGIRGEGDIVFCANVCEEGLGDFRGTKYVFGVDGDALHQYDGFVSIDDKNTAGIIYQAVGSERYLVTFRGAGGHSYTGFGTPSPIHAMGRAIAKISDFQVPSDPKTTFNVGIVNGGSSVNVIAEEASMLVDMRSLDANALTELSAKFYKAVEEAVEEENARWGLGTGNSTSGGITVNFEQKGKRPAGTQEKQCQIVQAANAANQALGMETLYIGAASTDANIPISLGIPAITVGWGGKGGGEHTIHEWYEHTESWKGPQRDLLLLLALSGFEGNYKYQLPHIANFNIDFPEV